MDVQEQLLAQLDALEKLLALLWEQSTEGPDNSIPRDQGREEFRTAVEELHVAVEQMALAGDTVADERRRYQDLFEFAPDAYAVTDSNAVLREVKRATSQAPGLASTLHARSHD